MDESIPGDPTSTLYCTFFSAGHWFGVPAKLVREVHALTTITLVPGAPPSVLGYANLRGQLFLVLKARELLTDRESCDTEAPHLIVFSAAAGEYFAIQADAVGEMTPVRRDQIDRPNANLDAAGAEVHAGGHCQCVIGRARLEHALLTLIDPGKFLAAAFDPAAPS